MVYEKAENRGSIAKICGKRGALTGTILVSAPRFRHGAVEWCLYYIRECGMQFRRFHLICQSSRSL